MENPITIHCPWCGEAFVSFFDASAGPQNYIEDCQVCCRPIVCDFQVDSDGEVAVSVERS